MTLPPLQELLAGATAYRIPLTTRFRGLTHRHGLLVEGPSGWGEFAPFDDYSVVADARWLNSTVEATHGNWPKSLRDTVEVNAIVPLVPAEAAFEIVRKSSCRTAKVKVGGGGGIDDDVARVAAVRDALGPEGKLRIDVNGAWSAPEAERALKVLGEFSLEYVEQPCATIDELSALRRSVDVPIAVDEGLRTAPEPGAVLGLSDAADVLILKAAPLGGVNAAVDIGKKYGIPVAVSSALETSIGLSAGLALAAAVPHERYASGLGTATLLAADVTSRSLVPEDGQLLVTRPVVDRSLLATVASSRDLDAWHSRLTRAYHALHAALDSRTSRDGEDARP